MDKMHPTHLTSIVPNEKLGQEIMALRYDLVDKVLVGMLQECQRQAHNDSRSGRFKLARALHRLSHTLNGCLLDMSSVTEVCHKFIEQEKAVQEGQGSDQGTDAVT
jgi:hypothetical protein